MKDSSCVCHKTCLFQRGGKRTFRIKKTISNLQSWPINKHNANKYQSQYKVYIIHLLETYDLFRCNAFSIRLKTVVTDVQQAC